jgi:hypothetical protein
VGLFGWLFGPRESERVAVRELIWVSAAARARGVVGALRDHLGAGRSVLVLAHFPSTLAALGPDLVEAKVPHDPIPDGLTPAGALRLAGGSPRVLFGLVRNLKPDDFPAADAPDSPLPVVLAERHFLRRHDDRVTRFAEGLGGRATVAVHPSLDDHLMKLFAGEWVRNVLMGLGMQEDEALDSAMVSRRIRAAQEKFRSSAPDEDVPADSPAEWLRLNVR